MSIFRRKPGRRPEPSPEVFREVGLALYERVMQSDNEGYLRAVRTTANQLVGNRAPAEDMPVFLLAYIQGRLDEKRREHRRRWDANRG